MNLHPDDIIDQRNRPLAPTRSRFARLIDLIGIALLAVMVGNGILWLFAQVLLVGMAIADTPLSGCEGLSVGDCIVFAAEGR